MINNLRAKIKEELEKITDKKLLEDLRVKYLGRKGELTAILKNLKELAADERAKIGAQANKLKNEIEAALAEKEQTLKEKIADLKQDWLDISAPGLKLAHGHLHPRTQIMRQIEDIFTALGFSVIEGPELETQWYNFEALNMPKDHPARDMQDTFYVKNPAKPSLAQAGGQAKLDQSRAERGSKAKLDQSRAERGGDDLVLRTQTSPMQVRFMEKNNPPLRIIVPGKVFRNEATDATHEFQLFQFEGLMVDKHISAANFKAIIEEFFKRLYGQKAIIRLRPSFFPFVEPGFEVDMACVFCGQAKLDQSRAQRGGQIDCRICKDTGWIEMGGAGMVNQFVFESAGYARDEWQGFAFGFGLERLAMLKYKINDIRLMTGGDMAFLKQF